MYLCVPLKKLQSLVFPCCGNCTTVYTHGCAEIMTYFPGRHSFKVLVLKPWWGCGAVKIWQVIFCENIFRSTADPIYLIQHSTLWESFILLDSADIRLKSKSRHNLEDVLSLLKTEKIFLSNHISGILAIHRKDAEHPPVFLKTG